MNGATLAVDDQALDQVAATRAEAFLLGGIADERRHRRIFISLPVRFMLADQGEHRGVLFDMSPGGLSVTSDLRPAIGTRVVLYIDDIGRVEGTTSRFHDYGFAVRLNTTQNRRDKIAERLIFHANRHRLRDEALRSHERIESDQEAYCRMPDGAEIVCRVIDLSLSGAAIAVDPPPAVGTEIALGRMLGRVVRRIPQGVAIHFVQKASSHAGLADRLVRR